MTSSKTKGRMITRDISDSKGFASLSPPAATLFCMMIPHYTAHGKMNGDPGYIKGEVCPRISYLTTRNLPDYLEEISKKTSVKWFSFDGRYWIHSLNFLVEHQNLDPERIGQDLLPTYSGVGPLEAEVEVEEEVEVEGKIRRQKQVKVKHLDFVLLSEAEYMRLVETLGEENVKTKIAALNEYIGSKGKKYASHYFTILSWARKEGLPMLSAIKEKREELSRCQHIGCSRKGTAKIDNSRYCSEHLGMI